MTSTPSLETLISRLRGLYQGKIDLCLDRIEVLLQKLDNPHTHMPPVVHVAGTNGKGSTLAFIRAMAEAQGLRVHVYTSPHLVRLHERFVVAGHIIDEGTLVKALQDVERVNHGSPITFFEIMTAAAFLIFSQQPADLVLLETGLGGRYDATNVIKNPALSLITPVDLDHQAFLGETLSAIAREKAGIIKSHRPVILGPQDKTARDILSAQAQALEAPLHVWGEDYKAFLQEGRLIYQDETRLLDLPVPALRGQFQLENAGLAVAAALALGLRDDAIAKGLQAAHWPGRLHRLTEGILADRVDAEGGEVWLDGAHNAHGARGLATAMADLEQNAPKPLVLIAALKGNKDRKAWLDPFKGLASLLISVPLPKTSLFDGQGAKDSPKPQGPAFHEDAFEEAELLAELAREAGLPALFAPSVSSAVQGVLALEKTPRLLITGSLHLVGSVLQTSDMENS